MVGHPTIKMINSIIAEVSKESSTVSLSEISPKDKPWDIHAQERDEISSLYSQADHPYAGRMSDCSQWLEFALKQKDSAGVLGLNLQDSRFCRVRHCPVCQWRRSLKWRAKFFQVLPEIRKAYPMNRFLFLTLTVRNCELLSLHLIVAFMHKVFAKLVRYKNFPAVGWIRSLEVTRGLDGSAHPHFHCLLMVDNDYFQKQNYLTQADWSEAWRKALGVSYTPIVNVKVVKPKKGFEGDGLEVAVCETLKYSVKPSDLVADRDWLIGLTDQLHRVRAVATGGVFKKFLRGLGDEPKDLIHVDDSDDENEQELGRLYFEWSQQIKRYTT